MFNLFIKPNTLFRAISGVFSASQPQPNGCVCDAANETTRLGFAEQRYWLHGIFWSIGSILPIKLKTQNSRQEQRGGPPSGIRQREFDDLKGMVRNVP